MSESRKSAGLPLRYADSAMLLAEDTLPYISRTYPGADQLRRVLIHPRRLPVRTPTANTTATACKGFCLTVCLAS